MDKATKIELVYNTLQDAKDMILLAFKPQGKKYGSSMDIEDEKIKEYFYAINDMCIELADRKEMLWQMEDYKDED